MPENDLNNTDPLFLEKVIIKTLFKKVELRERIMPFLKTELFHSFEAKKITTIIFDFIEKYQIFPTKKSFKLELEELEKSDPLTYWNECLNLDLNNYNDDHLYSKVEEFIKESLLYNIFTDAVSNMEDKEFSGIEDVPNDVREALSFSFNTEIGFDIFTDKGKDDMYDHLHNKDKTISTGVSYLDNMVDGGYHEKSLTLFLGETNIGKSLILCATAVNAILNNKRVLYITLEMSEKKISERVLANIFDVNLSKLKYLKRSEYNKLYDKYKKQFKQLCVVKEYAPDKLNANGIRFLLKELDVKKKFKPDLLVIDYMGLMTRNKANKNDNSYTEVKKIAEEIRGISVESKIPMPVVSAIQTNRGGFKTMELDLTDSADSIGPAATADLIIGIAQNDELREMGVYIWLILKNRYGINKLKTTVDVDYPKMRIGENKEEVEKSVKYKTINRNVLIDDTVKATNIVKNINLKDKKSKRKKIINFK